MPGGSVLQWVRDGGGLGGSGGREVRRDGEETGDTGMEGRVVVDMVGTG